MPFMKIDTCTNVHAANPVTIGHAKGVTIKVSRRASESAPCHGRFTGLHTCHSPILTFTTVDHTRHTTKIVCHISLMQHIVIEILADHSTLVTAADDKITNAMRRIDAHHMPKNRLTSNGDHRLRTNATLFTDSRAESSRQNDRLHMFFIL